MQCKHFNGELKPSGGRERRMWHGVKSLASVRPQRRSPVSAVVPQVRPVLMRSAEGRDQRRWNQSVPQSKSPRSVKILKAFGRLLPPLRLVPPVLEPDFHLGLGQSQDGGQVGSLRGRQVPLLAEFLLQLEHLKVGERGSGALLLGRGGEGSGAAGRGRVQRFWSGDGIGSEGSNCEGFSLGFTSESLFLTAPL